jgi:hypothetical protein
MTIKIYTFDLQHKNRRIAWYNKETSEQKYEIRRTNPVYCHACNTPLETGERVVTKNGKPLSHIYHLKCAKNKKLL